MDGSLLKRDVVDRLLDGWMDGFINGEEMRWDTCSSLGHNYIRRIHSDLETFIRELGIQTRQAGT